MNLIRVCPLALLAAASMPCCALAFDLGDPWFHDSPDAYAHKIEYVVGRYRRRIVTQDETILVGTADGGPLGTLHLDRKLKSRLLGNHQLLRYTYRAFPSFAAQFDLGESGKSSGGSSVLIVGGAVRFLLMDRGPFQLTTQASMHFVPEIDTAATGTHSSLGDYTASGTESSHDYGLALIGALQSPEYRGVRTVIYGGPRLSGVRSEAKSVVDYENPFMDGTTPVGSRFWFDITRKQTSVLDGVLGLRADFGERWSGRIEGRFAEESSVSLGFSARF